MTTVTVTPATQAYTSGNVLVYLQEFIPIDVDLFPANTNGNISWTRYYFVEGEIWTVQPDDTQNWTVQ